MKKIFTAFSVLVVFSVSIFSQELSELRVTGKGKIIPEELIDKNIRDVNGEVCAGLMVLSDLDGLTYTSYNQIVKINRMPGKDMLFLSPEERVVEVYRTGYKPLKIILIDHGVKLTSGKVWQLEITGDKKIDLIPVNIIADQPDVKVFLDGQDKGIGKTHLVSAGQHQLRLEKDGYKTIEATIDVSATNNLFNYKMQEIDLLQVQIKSVPTGARILLENSERGETDKGLFLLPGKHKLKLTKSGYFDKEDSIEVSETKSNIFSYNLEKSEGFLTLNVEPADARVLINKEDYTGKKEVSLPQGKYKIEIEKQGFSSVSETFEMKLGSSLSKTYKLTERTGGLQFSIQPLEANAKLISSGIEKYSWQGMKVFKDLPVGQYTLECTLNGYKKISKPITIEDGKTRTEDIQLEKGTAEDIAAEDDNSNNVKTSSRGGGISWYYYAGAAVVGGVAAILLLKPSDNGGSSTKSSGITVTPSRPGVN